jgi:integrase
VKGNIQRYICRECGTRFSQTTWNSSEGSKHNQEIHKQILNRSVALPYGRQVGVAQTREAKNLAETQEIPTQEKAQRGANATDIATIKGKIIEFLWWMEKEGFAKDTIRGYGSCLRALLQRNADLLDPESVKEVLAKEKRWSQNRRRNVINAYTLFLKFNGARWEKPRCKVDRKIPFIPAEQEIDCLIAGNPKKVATFLQLLKETAFRSGEAKRLLWTDIDFEKRLITLNQPEKNSLPGIYKVSQKLIDMLNALPRKSLRIFGDGPINSIKVTFIKARRRLAHKLQNPRLLQIHFHTLRHWKATMEYHRTKDIFHVKEFLRHKKLENIALYVQIDESLFKDSDEGFTCRIAHNTGEAISLIEVGFEYVTGEYSDGGKLFRKRK